MKEVVRNDAEGNAHHEDGCGRTFTPVLQPPADLKSCAPWMDAANIDFGIDSLDPQASLLYDVVETRVFDHATRQQLELAKGYEAIGWELMQPGLLQLRALGRTLPDAVDVWFRINSYADARRLIMQPKTGSSVQIGSGTLSVIEARKGTWSKKWGGDQIQWLSGPQNPGAASTIALQWQGAWPANERWQIGGVTKRNQPVWGPVIDLTGHGTREKTIADLSMPLQEIAYLELRPEGIQKAFYFNNVRLPAVGNRRFLPPPPAQFKIEGKEGRFTDYLLNSKEYSLSPVKCSTSGRTG